TSKLLVPSPTAGSSSLVEGMGFLTRGSECEAAAPASGARPASRPTLVATPALMTRRRDAAAGNENERMRDLVGKLSTGSRGHRGGAGDGRQPRPTWATATAG